MRSEHRAPLVASILVVLVCIGVVAHAVRTDALGGIAARLPAGMIAAPMLHHKHLDAVPAQATADAPVADPTASRPPSPSRDRDRSGDAAVVVRHSKPGRGDGRPPRGARADSPAGPAKPASAAPPVTPGHRDQRDAGQGQQRGAGHASPNGHAYGHANGHANGHAKPGWDRGRGHGSSEEERGGRAHPGGPPGHGWGQRPGDHGHDHGQNHGHDHGHAWGRDGQRGGHGNPGRRG